MNLNFVSKKFYLDLFVITIIFLLDRFSKLYVIYLSEKNGTTLLFLSNYLNIQLVWNEGIAFGLFSFDENYLYNILSIIILMILIFLFVMILKSDGLKKYSFLVIFAGAIGNFYDRIFYQRVTDFIDFHINGFHWFIFNLADVFITIGVFFVILLEIIDNNSDIDEKSL